VAKGKRNNIVLASAERPGAADDLPSEKREDAGEAQTPEVVGSPEWTSPSFDPSLEIDRVFESEDGISSTVLYKRKAEDGVAPPPTPPQRPRAAPGKIRLRASAYFKDGQILGPDKCDKPFVNEGGIIEVTPETFKQLRESAPNNWTVL
jgi:hypothetical protein